MKRFIIHKIKEIHCAVCVPSNKRQIMINAAINTRDITKSMVRTRSSNLWSYTINIDKYGDDIGDVYIQFKNSAGGAGDIYVYYDVPVKVYRKLVSAPSKGHYFWQAIRNKYAYSKLTGDKRTKLSNGI